MPFVIIPDDERKEVNIKHNISNRTFDSPGWKYVSKSGGLVVLFKASNFSYNKIKRTVCSDVQITKMDPYYIFQCVTKFLIQMHILKITQKIS